ncbi:MAG: hypothetical protein RBQ88_06330 [Desulfobulbus oligotrophicus]|jgi:hypothetical protein|nr:hypothetical protein [Desulfobulbus oligotrophicus]
MISGVHFAIWQRYIGILAMILMTGALLSLADALIGGLGGPRGLIELVPGSRFQISGPMPPRTDTLKDVLITGQPKDGSVRLLPENIFTGYWLGGSMWRGVIEVADFAREDSVVIAVRDRFGEKQNPALVFKVQIWPDEATRNEHSPSFITRKTGLSPYIFAVTLALMGMMAAGGNFFFGHLWSRHLAAHHCGEIFRLRQTQNGVEITCELPHMDSLSPGTKGAVYRPAGEYVCPATIISSEPEGVLMLADLPEHVRLGDIVCVLPETDNDLFN